MVYRGYSLSTHKFGIEIKNAKTGGHCGFSDTIAQANSVIDEIMVGRAAGEYAHD